MAQPASDFDELYVIARRVLLDAFDALSSHLDAIVLVGAQAVYLRVGEANLAVTPFTSDGDLVIDPTALAEIPPLEQALMAANFLPRSASSVGIWITTRKTSKGVDAEVAIDLLVPASVSPGTGRRAARLPGHDMRAARIVRGLDGAVVDLDVMRVRAIEDTDTRTFDVRVAGPAALLVAKLHKISDREGTDRQTDKDALDVLRLLRGTSTEELASRYHALFADKRSAVAALDARNMLEVQFARRSSVGVQMAIRSAGVLGDEEEIASSCTALASDLLAVLK